MKETVQVNGHSLEIFASRWNGKEIVKYDGAEVSSRTNMRTFTSFHSFSVTESGEEVVYEVEIVGGLFSFAYAVRRNGIIRSHKP